MRVAHRTLAQAEIFVQMATLHSRTWEYSPGRVRLDERDKLTQTLAASPRCLSIRFCRKSSQPIEFLYFMVIIV